MAETPKLLSAVRCLWPAGATLGEGTLWSPSRQALYWVDILGRQLYRYTPATQARESWPFDEEISAVAERANGRGLLVTLRSGFAFFDPETKKLEHLHDPEADQPGNRFNDGKCDAQGRFWGGTMDFACSARTGALYRFDADRRCTLTFDARFAVTNGPTWSLDGRTLYFNETAEQRIFAFDFEPDSGTLSNQRLWLSFKDGEGYPDGMTTDGSGRLWIAHWGASRVTCHDPVSAEVLAQVDLPTSHISNCTFGGPDMRTLFITSARQDLNETQLAAQPQAGGLFAVDTDTVGRPSPLFAG